MTAVHPYSFTTGRSKPYLRGRGSEPAAEATNDMFGSGSRTPPGNAKAKRNPNIMLESLISLVFMRDSYKALYQTIHGRLLPGPERKFSMSIYDTRTASMQLYALRESGPKIEWKERMTRMPLATARGKLQNNIKIVVHQLITSDAIVAGMRLTSGLDAIELTGWLSEGQQLEFSDLDAVLEGMEIDAYQTYEV